MNQRERAEHAIKIFDEALDAVGELGTLLHEILDEAQNSPPDGASDGSIDEQSFNQLRDGAFRAQAARRLLRGFK